MRGNLFHSLLFLTLFPLLTFAQLQHQLSSPSSRSSSSSSSSSIDVVKLTKENYLDYFKKHEIVFVNFYADWCHFSRLLTPIFQEAYQEIRKEFESERVLFAKVDCDQETELASHFQISKYPTLKQIVDGNVHKREYRGQRSKEGLLAHVRKYLEDPIVHLEKNEDFVSKLDSVKPALLAFFAMPPKSGPEYEALRRVARFLRDECNFYWITGEASMTHNHQGHVNYVSFKQAKHHPSSFDELYTGDLQSADQLHAWATPRCVPIVREITFENAEELTEERIPFVILFHAPGDQESVQIYKELVKRELMHEVGQVNFLTADGHKFAHPLLHLGKSKADLPLIAVDSFRHMYLFPQFSDIRIPNKLRTFIQDLHSGKLHREFHFGPDQEIQIDTAESKKTSPPESTFKRLQPSSNRYTLLRDEL